MLAMNACIFGGLAALPLTASAEWYDPRDWFDDNETESTSDGQNWWNDHGWHDRYDYTNPMATALPYSYYYWNPVVDQWTIDDSKKPSQNSNAGNQGNRNIDTTTFDGKVDGFKKVKLSNQSGVNEDQSFVRIRLKNGDSQVISLGSRVDLAELDLQKGDSIKVSGRQTRIDNRDILIAHQIKADGRSLTISEKNRPEFGQQVSIEGTVRDYERTNLGGNSRDESLIVRLEMKEGKNCVVDLGQGTTLQDLDLEKGSKVRIEGEKTQVQGKSLIVARKIRVDGDKTQLRDEKPERDAAPSRDPRGSDPEYSTSRGNQSDESNYEPLTTN